MTLPERIAKVRYYGILVSDDGFYPTPTGPVHIDDLELGRALVAHDDLLAALQISTTTLETVLQNDSKNIAAKCCIERNRAAIAKAEQQ